MKERTYRKRLEAERGPEKYHGQFMAAKNARNHERREALKKMNKFLAFNRERMSAWAKMSDEEKWQELDRRLGIGKGASRQRMRLAKKLNIEYKIPDYILN